MEGEIVKIKRELAYIKKETTEESKKEGLTILKENQVQAGEAAQTVVASPQKDATYTSQNTCLTASVYTDTQTRQIHATVSQDEEGNEDEIEAANVVKNTIGNQNGERSGSLTTEDNVGLNFMQTSLVENNSIKDNFTSSQSNKGRKNEHDLPRMSKEFSRKETSQRKKTKTYIIGGSRARDIYRHMKSTGCTDIYTRYRGGSTIAWARGEIKEREEGSRIVVQTGANNILNTKQENQNIPHQFKVLIRENRDKKIILTSILPFADRNGNVETRIDEINKELAKLANRENVTFIDLTDILVSNHMLNLDLYKKEGRYIHFNSDGNRRIVEKIDQIFKQNGDAFLVKHARIFWRTGPQAYRR